MDNSLKAFDYTSGKIYENTGLFLIKEANHWIEDAKKRPIPKMLFSEFWFEGEVCILFADSNLGKSLLAVQIADSISKGLPIVAFKFEAKAQPVLYFDFELSDKQFELRYSDDFKDHYKWHPNLMRVEINPDAEIPNNKSSEEYLLSSIKKTISRYKIKILIIDNLTYLNNDSEKGNIASSLMKELKRLKNEFGLSILVIAHTPKRDASRPISRNDLAGSSRLMQFCDSSFAIGESHKDTGLRYLKQIKVRNTALLFGNDNVIVCELVKDENFVKFKFLTYAYESEHLKELNQGNRNGLIDQAKQLKAEGKSQREIASTLGIAVGTVNKYVNS